MKSKRREVMRWGPTLDDDERTTCSRHKHLVWDSGWVRVLVFWLSTCSISNVCFRFLLSSPCWILFYFESMNQNTALSSLRHPERSCLASVSHHLSVYLGYLSRRFLGDLTLSHWALTSLNAVLHQPHVNLERQLTL